MLVGFEVVAQHVVDTQMPRDRFGVDGQRRGTQHHGVAAVLMLAHDVAHVRIDARRYAVFEQFLAQHVEVGQRLAPQISRGTNEQPFEGHTADAVAHRRLDDPEDFAEGGLPAADAVTGVGRRGEAVDEGAVQVENAPTAAPPGPSSISARDSCGDKVGPMGQVDQDAVAAANHG